MKKNFRKPSGERSLIVRVFAIIVIMFMVMALILSMLPSIAFGDVLEGDDVKKGPDGRPVLVVDQADVLTDAEEQELLTGLESFRAEQDFDIVVVTVESLEGYNVVDYAELVYDYNGYGGGDEHDGAMILISEEERDWTMITTGYGITAITDYSLDRIEEEIIMDLSDGNYADAFKGFADHCAYCVREARNGNIIDEYIYDEDEGDAPSPGSAGGSGSSGGSSGSGSGGSGAGSGGRGEYPIAANAGAAGLIGIITSWFANRRKKAEMKSVRYRSQAREYMRENSLKLSENRDRYLYTTVSRIPINRERDDDHQRPGHFGGSTIHMGSSGTMHGGGRAGKF